MPILNTPRAGRNMPGYMETLASRMINARNTIFKSGYGVMDYNVESIVSSFRAVSNAYQKLNKVEVHYLELILEMDKEEEDVLALAHNMGSYFFSQGFQSFITVIVEREFYLIAIVINSVAFFERPVFHDNNYHYSEIMEYLNKITPYDWRIKASPGTFFDPHVGEGNYTHGYYI